MRGYAPRESIFLLSFLFSFPFFPTFLFSQNNFPPSAYFCCVVKDTGCTPFFLFSFPFFLSLYSAITVISHDQSAVRVTIKRIQRSDNPFAISRHSRTTSVDVNGTIRTLFPSRQFLDSKEQKRNAKYLIVSKKYLIVSSNVRGLSLC